MRLSPSLRRLLFDTVTALLIFSILAAILFIERRELSMPSAVEDSGLIDEDIWYEVRNEQAGSIAPSAPRALIVFDDKDSDSRALKDNVRFVLNSLFVQTETIIISQEEGAAFSPRYIEDREAVRPGEADDEASMNEAAEAASEEGNPAEHMEESAAGEGVSDAIPSDTDEPEEDETISHPPVDLPLSGCSDLVICISDLAFLNIDMDALRDWVSAGGHILFAQSPEGNEYLPLWYDLLGIANKEIVPMGNAESLLFTTDLMAGAKGMEFSDDVISCSVLVPRLSEDCIVHISTSGEEEFPLLWERPYGRGRVIVCNADIMGSKVDRGILASAYCRFYPAYVYPVINAAVYCIDDCPSPSPAGYEKNVLAQYGYTVSDFIANVWMPSMMELSDRYGIRFSTFLIQTYENDVDGPFTNTNDRESASYYAAQILNTGGEVGIHGYNHQPLIMKGYELYEENSGYTPWKNVRDMILSLKAAIAYGEDLCDDLFIESYVAPSNVISPEALQEMLAQLEDIRVYAGVYSGTPDQFIQEYSVLDNGVVFCPRLTADMQMEDSEWWTQINELNYHYIASNFIHPDDILDEDRSDGGDFRQMLNGYREMIEWNSNRQLRVCTISEAGGAVQRYANLSLRQELDGNTLTIHTAGLIDEAYLMLRTNGKKPVSVSGGTITQLAEDIYIAAITSDTIVITMVDKL